MNSSTLYIGFGNTLRGDDGVGPYVARRLLEQGIDAMEAVQLAPEMAERISGLGRVVFVDADVTVAPGEYRRTHLDPGGENAFEHHVTPRQLLAITESLYGSVPDAELVRFGVQSLEFGETLSEPVRQAADAFLRECV